MDTPMDNITLPPEIILAIFKQFLNREDKENTWKSLNAFVRATPVTAEYARKNATKIADRYAVRIQKHDDDIASNVGETEEYSQLPNKIKHGEHKRQDVFVLPYHVRRPAYIAIYDRGVMLVERDVRVKHKEPFTIPLLVHSVRTTERRPDHPTMEIIDNYASGCLRNRFIITGNFRVRWGQVDLDHDRQKILAHKTVGRSVIHLLTHCRIVKRVYIDETFVECDLPEFTNKDPKLESPTFWHGDRWEHLYGMIRDGKFNEWLTAHSYYKLETLGTDPPS
jgi:hypothetical protein